MSLLLKFGSPFFDPEDGEVCVRWHGSVPHDHKEQDGTDTAYGGDGSPSRFLHYETWEVFCKKVPAAAALEPLSEVDEDGEIRCHVTPQVVAMLHRFTKTESLDPKEKDILTWLQYWSTRSLQEFGGDAWLTLSF